MALHDIVESDRIEAAASVTRNPAVPRLMASSFYTVSPDLQAADPLHHFKDDGLVRHLTEVYATHVEADPSTLPFVPGRYGDGLYGGDDPGRRLTMLPEIAEHPGNGIIMVAIDRIRRI